jgi:indole-3-glycerol phosphate synthase
MRNPSVSRPDVLSSILARKRDEVASLRASRSLASMRAEAEAAPAARDFVGALTGAAGRFAIIAEVKRKSPSAGWIRAEWSGEDFAPENIARGYESNGAAAISCLTDTAWFGGEVGYLGRVKAAVGLPVMRKDFIIDASQVYEARAAGADAVLLIAECLDDAALRDLHALARELGMGVLLEAHDDDQLRRAVEFAGDPPRDGTLVGVSNRDLRTLTVDLERSVRAGAGLKHPRFLVAESGVGEHADLERLSAAGVRIALVGERLMRHAEPGEALARLLRPGAKP